MPFSAGEVGNVLPRRMVDSTGAVIDVSSATTKEILWTRSDGTTFTSTLTFYTDGSDGKVLYTVAAGDLTDWGWYEYMIHIVLTDGTVVKSKVIPFEILRSL